MPTNPQSLRLTDGYRDRLQDLRSRAETLTRRTWAAIDTSDLGESFADWVDAIVPAVGTLQQAAVGLTEVYLGAYAGSELGRPHDVEIDPEPYADVDAFGRPLAQALGTPLLTVKSAIGDGKPLAVAMREGLNRATMLNGEAVVEAARLSQFAAMDADPAFLDWRRVPRGTCGACLSDTDGKGRPFGEPLNRHPNCLCVGEGRVRGVRERHQRPTGDQILADMSPEAMVAQFGPAKTELLRSGEIVLADLAHRHELALGGSVLYEATLAEATT